MADHDRRDPRLYRRTKGNQLCFLEARERMIDDRQAAMRIDIGVTVSGKMFGGGEYVLALDALDELNAEFSYGFGIFTKAADIDNRITRVVVYVEHRGINVIDADRFCFASRDDADSTSEV